jgi:hypothetical protein
VDNLIGDPKSPLTRTSGTSWGTISESELPESMDSIVKNIVSVVRQVEDEGPPTARIKPVPTVEFLRVAGSVVTEALRSTVGIRDATTLL